MVQFFARTVSVVLLVMSVTASTSGCDRCRCPRRRYITKKREAHGAHEEHNLVQFFASLVSFVLFVMSVTVKEVRTQF